MATVPASAPQAAACSASKSPPALAFSAANVSARSGAEARSEREARGQATCASHARPTLKLAGGDEGVTRGRPASSLECLGLCSPYFWGPRGGQPLPPGDIY